MLGIITLLVGSFMYTEEVGTTAKLSDTLLLEIKEKQNNYKIPATEATIKDGTIIPGINGKVVDINKSYNKMKQIGYFNDKLLVYKTLPVKNPLKENMDKYVVSTNKKEKNISLIFKITGDKSLNNILSALNSNESKGTFYIDSNFLENNHNEVIKLIESGHTIGNLSDKEDYENGDFVWMKTIITNAGAQKYNYCYTESKNINVLKICNIQKSYTIIPTTVVKTRPFINVKQNLKPGAIISLEVNSELNEEIENIVNYINGKGYKITALEKALQE